LTEAQAGAIGGQSKGQNDTCLDTAAKLPEGKYRVLVVDPPWAYSKRAADAFQLLLGRRYNRMKKAHGGDRKSKAQNEPLISTASKLAKEHGVSAATVKRAAKFAEEVERTPALKQAIREKTHFSYYLGGDTTD